MGIAGNYIYADTDWNAATTITTDTITVDGWGNTVATKGKPKKKKPETALAWLDRRVEEMRLAL